jgi:hypothetical protein
VFIGTGQFYVACALGDLGTNAYQALIQFAIMDVFLAHDRGTMLAFYLRVSSRKETLNNGI